MDAPFRAYIKDCLHLNEKPKHFLTILSGNPSGDILTSASSSFTCVEEISDEIREGDIFCLYNQSGNVVYTGVIKAKEDREIQTEQIYAYFNQEWFTHIDKKPYLEEEIAAIFTDFISGKLGEIVTTLPEADITTYEANRNYFVYDTNDGTPIYKEYRVNRYEEKVGEHSDETQIVYRMDEIGQLPLADISQITDPLHTAKYGVFTVTYENSQQIHLTTPENLGEMRNLEEFIYSLYDQYRIIVEITIPYESGCNIHIKTVNYDGTKIAKNTSNVIEITPKTETQEVNKLVIFGSAGNFRKTYYATENGVVNDGSDTNRLPVLKTTYIYSDDSLDDIKAENIKDEMYNHEIKFELILNNKLYDFYSWKFGEPLEVYYKGKVYTSIFTGYEYSFDPGEKPASVEITCGIVRTKLTDKLNMGKKEISASTGLSISSSSSGGGSGVSKEYVDAGLATKVDKVEGKGLSANDYTTAEKSKLAGIAAGATANIGTITGITMNGTSKGTSGVVNLGTVLTEHQDISGKADRSELPTVNNATLTIQKNGTTVKTFTANASSNVTANITVPTAVSQLTNDSGYTKNTGTITGITMNGSSKGSSGIVDLGTVITEHQDISGKVDKVNGKGLSANDYTTAEKNKLANIAANATRVIDSTVSGWGYLKSADIANKQDKITPITAVTSQAIYPVTIDTQGHITSVGAAAVIPEGVVVDLQPSSTSNNAIANSATYSEYIHKSGTQTYNINGTTFSVGNVTFKIEEVT